MRTFPWPSTHCVSASPRISSARVPLTPWPGASPPVCWSPWSAWLLARRITAPVARLAEAARQIGAGESPSQLPESGEHELAELARVFNQTSAQLAARRENQSTLLAGISHDLRSPSPVQDGLGHARRRACLAPARAHGARCRRDGNAHRRTTGTCPRPGTRGRAGNRHRCSAERAHRSGGGAGAWTNPACVPISRHVRQSLLLWRSGAPSAICWKTRCAMPGRGPCKWCGGAAPRAS